MTVDTAEGKIRPMVTDGPLPFVPYMCGALAGTAINEWTKRWCRKVACGIDPDPSYGFGRLLLFTLVLLASGWLAVVAREGIFGSCTLIFSQFTIMSADERRERWSRARTSQMKPWQFVICLLPMTPLFLFIGLVIFNDGRVPDFSPEMRSLWSRLREGSEVLRHTFSGFFVVTVADIILEEWWRWFAWRAAPPTPRSR